jgi:hypothetical protein
MWTNLLCISHNHILVHLSCHSITKTKQGPFNLPPPPDVGTTFLAIPAWVRTLAVLAIPARAGALAAPATRRGQRCGHDSSSHPRAIPAWVRDPAATTTLAQAGCGRAASTLPSLPSLPTLVGGFLRCTLGGEGGSISVHCGKNQASSTGCSTDGIPRRRVVPCNLLVRLGQGI